MDTEDFKRTGEDLFGNSWQTRMARALGIDGSTVRRWVGATIPVPPAIQAFLAMMGDRQEARGALTFAMQRLGSPGGVKLETPEGIGRMTKRLRFPGVDQPKPMPAIVTGGSEDEPTAMMSDEAADRIHTEGVSYQITRHPDSRHARGYVGAAERAGHDVSTIHVKHHHYTLLAHTGEPTPGTAHMIATHSGAVRLLRATTRDPLNFTEERLDALPGADVSADAD